MLCWRFVVAVACLLAACTSGDKPASVSIPGDAMSVDEYALFAEALSALADLRPDDELYQLPVGDDHAVFVRIRADEPPLLFGTSCDVVSAAPLASGWQGACLEYTWQGRRINGRFPHGTSSVQAPARDAGSTSPQGAALAAAQLTYPAADVGTVDSMVVIYADAAMVDLRVKVDDGDFCQWYRVTGRVEGSRLVYRAEPAAPCESEGHAAG